MSTTYTELKSQYPALRETIGCVNADFTKIADLFESKKPQKIIYLGCGSSYHIAESLAVMTQIHMNMDAFAIPAGDLMLHMERYERFFEHSVIIAVTRSGSTSELLITVKEIKERTQSPVISIICTVGSELLPLSDITLEMPWAFDVSVCQTRTVSCLYMAGAMLTAKLSGNKDLEQDLNKTVEEGPRYLERYEEFLKSCALRPWDKAVVLADAEMCGIAAEGALAFKEISQIHSNYYHLLDSRHGPFVILGKNTFVLAALSEPNCSYEIDIVGELVQKGCTVVCYCDVEPKGLDKQAQVVTFGQPLAHAARGIPFILLAQLTAYYKAVALGVDPDTPAGLTPWIRL